MGISVKGTFAKTNAFLRAMKRRSYLDMLESFGQLGVEALALNTPKDSGRTSECWGYEIEIGDKEAVIRWTNSNVQKGYFNVAVALQLGHGTGTGGYVRGRDYINPAIQPIFDRIAEYAWKEVTTA